MWEPVGEAEAGTCPTDYLSNSCAGHTSCPNQTTAETALYNFFTTIGTQILLYANTAQFYPQAIRSTGLGWASGVGRTGAIVGPLLGGCGCSRHRWSGCAHRHHEARRWPPQLLIRWQRPWPRLELRCRRQRLRQRRRFMPLLRMSRTRNVSGPTDTPSRASASSGSTARPSS